jgi:hypothetical protein
MRATMAEVPLIMDPLAKFKPVSGSSMFLKTFLQDESVCSLPFAS